MALSFALVGPLRAEPLEEAQTFTLQFQDIEVRRAIHTLGELAHKDIVTSDGVSGTMSLNLVDVTWHQALELILHTQNLAQQRAGDVLTIAPVEQFEAVRKAELQRQQELLQLQPLA
ncbi:MAG: secretin and TonB N-terminal domain-containing protein, partial [Pseudomonadota bacterium]|nr:secretin and TonB N-terminal domain-containing protein [Pseudomonadota bacterium]